LLIGYWGLLVDYPQRRETDAITIADAQTMGLRPSMHLYKAEDILGTRFDRVNNATVLVMARLRESVLIPGANEFEEKYEDRFRVLDLVNGVYRVRIYKVEKAVASNMPGQDILLDEFTPLMNGKPLDFVPFEVKRELCDPPLLDLINTNVSHYRTTVDYEHGCHFTGLPTPWIAGYVPENPNDKLYIGSAAAWTFPDPNARAEYLALNNDFIALAANLTRKEQHMAVLGARMLEPQKLGVESADYASIHRKGEESVLSSIALELSDHIERALGWFRDWAGTSGDATYQINNDFYPVPMTPEQLTALIAGWQAGAFSDQTLFENLQQGQIIDADTTLEEEQARISASPPRLVGTMPPA
jgi:hypothetical protein